MGVTLREKKLKNGKISLYLDYYPAIVNPVTGKKSRREFLKLYLYDKPKGELEKRHNKETKTLANKIEGERGLQVQNEEYDVFNKVHKAKDFLQYFKDLTQEKCVSLGNYGNWFSAYNHLENFTNGSCKMGDIDERFCNDFKKYLLTANKVNTKTNKKISNNSAVSYFRKFRSAVKQAFEERYLNNNPLDRVKGIKEVQTTRQFLTTEEVSTLAKLEFEIPISKQAAIFSAMSGLRFGDMKKLIWSDIQYSKDKGWFIYIKNEKTGSPDFHPLSNQAVQWLGEKGEQKEKVFIGLKYSGHTNKKIQKWVNYAGIDKKISFHNFRHTYATVLLNNGVDIAAVSKLMNHKNIMTTMIYAKVMDKTKIAAANKINFDI